MLVARPPLKESVNLPELARHEFRNTARAVVHWLVELVQLPEHWRDVSARAADQARPDAAIRLGRGVRGADGRTAPAGGVTRG
jgi:hypothetical protein